MGHLAPEYNLPSQPRLHITLPETSISPLADFPQKDTPIPQGE